MINLKGCEIMNQQISIYEREGLDRYGKEKQLWKALFACNELYEFVANNMDEIPDMQYDDLFSMVHKLLELKYSVLALLGRSK